MWTVTRQRQWPEGDLVVEISSGSYDFCNPGTLVAKYSGEGSEFTLMSEAVETAIEIAQQWQKDKPNSTILIGYGCTGGYTMPFDGMELTEETFAELRDKAREHDEDLPKCDRCGDVLEKEHIKDEDNSYCSSYCWEEDHRETIDSEEEEEDK